MTILHFQALHCEANEMTLQIPLKGGDVLHLHCGESDLEDIHAIARSYFMRRQRKLADQLEKEQSP